MKILLESETHSIAKNKQLILKSNLPIKSIDPEGFMLNSEKLEKTPTLYNAFKLMINLDSVPQESNNLTIDKGAIISLIDSSIDSTVFNIDLKKENYGNLNIYSKNVPKNTIIELFENDKVIRRRQLGDTTSIRWIPPGEYKLRSFIDNNQNNLWDAGELKSNKAPEIIKIYKETISIRKNWDIELTISPP